MKAAEQVRPDIVVEDTQLKRNIEEAQANERSCSAGRGLLCMRDIGVGDGARYWHGAGWELISTRWCIW